MDGNGQHIAAFPENALGAITVMAINIQHRNTLRARIYQCLCRERGVVHIAMSTSARGIGVMAGRATKRIGAPPRSRFARGSQGASGGTLNRLPGAGTYWAGGIGHIPTRTRNNAIRTCGTLRQHLRRGVHIRNHLWPRIGKCGPIARGFGQKIQVIRAMNGVQRGNRHGIWRAWRKPKAMQRRFQRRRAGGDFEIRARAPANQKERRLMPGMVRMGEGFHAAKANQFWSFCEAAALAGPGWAG